MRAIDFEPRPEDADGRAPEWDAARHALLQAGPPERVEAALLRAMARRHAGLPWYRRGASAILEALAAWAGVGAAACAIAIACAGLHAGQPSPRLVVAGDGFVPLAAGDAIRATPNLQIRRADLPRRTLVRLGIPIAADAPDELVRAELLVASTGEALAVRLALN